MRGEVGDTTTGDADGDAIVGVADGDGTGVASEGAAAVAATSVGEMISSGWTAVLRWTIRGE